MSTSKRLGGKGGGSHKVNRRAVLASYQFRHAGLKNVCVGMNLPPLLAKNAYNEHLKQIEQASTNHAEQVMKDTAKRLKDKSPQNDYRTLMMKLTFSVADTVDGTWQKKRSLL